MSCTALNTAKSVPMLPVASEPLRVLCFGRYADADFGGLERVVKNLVQALAGEVEYTNLVADRGIARDLEGWPCRIVRSRALTVLAGTPICPTMPWTAARLHRKFRFHLAHLHFPDPMSHLAAEFLPGNVKIVITWHSDIVRQKRLLKLYWPSLKRIVARAAAVVVATPAHFSSLPQLRELARAEQLHVVPFGFDLTPYSSPHPLVRTLRGRFGSRCVFALGRHVYYKGFDQLIQAMRLIPDATLVIGGTGPLTSELQALALRLGIDDRILFPGRIADDVLPAYYQACDVFCMPSVEQSEAFGAVQVEAMASGRPVVCCDLGNGVTWVNRHGETGLVVPPRDPEALGQALRRLLDDPVLRRRLGMFGAARAVREFSLDALRVNTMAVYRKVLAHS